MKVTYRVNDKLTFEVEAETHTDLWEQLATIDELYKNTTCAKEGKGSTDDVKFVVRTNDADDKFYELQSDVAFGDKLYGAKKAFGAHKKGGGLFPQRKDKDGNYLPDNGWIQWDKTTSSVV